jgi:hypothetical protein
MRVLRICVYWLLLFPLLGFDSCKLKRNPTLRLQNCTVYISTVSPTQCTITLSSCAADTTHSTVEAWISASKNDLVTWKNDPRELPKRNYKVIFTSGSPFYTTSTPNPPVFVGTPMKVTGGQNCSVASPASCDFKYSLTSDGNACSDPGIHIMN